MSNIEYRNDKETIDKFEDYINTKCYGIGSTREAKELTKALNDYESKLKASEAECERLRGNLIQASEADWSEELNNYVRQLKKLKEQG